MRGMGPGRDRRYAEAADGADRRAGTPRFSRATPPNSAVTYTAFPARLLARYGRPAT
jgi:hypothetical protein